MKKKTPTAKMSLADIKYEREQLRLAVEALKDRIEHLCGVAFDLKMQSLDPSLAEARAACDHLRQTVGEGSEVRLS